MSVEVEVTEGLTSEGIIERFHAMSLSNDPVEAMVGRLSKALHEPISRVVQGELQRADGKLASDAMADIITGLVQGMMSLMISHAASLANEFNVDTAAVMEAVARNVTMLMAKTVEHAKNT